MESMMGLSDIATFWNGDVDYGITSKMNIGLLWKFKKQMGKVWIDLFTIFIAKLANDGTNKSM